MREIILPSQIKVTKDLRTNKVSVKPDLETLTQDEKLLFGEGEESVEIQGWRNLVHYEKGRVTLGIIEGKPTKYFTYTTHLKNEDERIRKNYS
jgi:hypothetical protein